MLHENAALVPANAIEWGYIDRHPFKNRVRVKGEKPRDRYVEDWEVIELLALRSLRNKRERQVHIVFENDRNQSQNLERDAAHRPLSSIGISSLQTLTRTMTHFPGALLAYGAPDDLPRSRPPGAIHGTTSS